MKSWLLSKDPSSWHLLRSLAIFFGSVFFLMDFAFFKYHQVQHHEKIHPNLSQIDCWINAICQWNDILLVVKVYKKGSNRQHLEPVLHLEEDNNRQHDRTPHKGDRMAICQLSFREGPWPNMARRPKQRKGDEQVDTTANDGKASAGWLTAHFCHRFLSRLPWDPPSPK